MRSDLLLFTGLLLSNVASTHTSTLMGLFNSKRVEKSINALDMSSDVQSVVRHRMDLLKRIGSSSPKPNCRQDTVLLVDDKVMRTHQNPWPYGKTGNIMMEFVHGLWVAETMNVTLKIPHYMFPIFRPFNDSQNISDYFCAIFEPNLAPNFLHIKPNDLLYVWRIFEDERYKSYFPALTKAVVRDVASLYLRVMALLWSAPTDNIFNAATWFIKYRLQNSLSYTSVHKRFMEGECPELFYNIANISIDFSPNELPMDHPSWRSISNSSFPLCSMDLDFIRATQNLANRHNQNIFLSYDGFGDIGKCYKSQVVTSGSLDFKKFPMFTASVNCQEFQACGDKIKFLDMFLAIHSDFFILNPRSSFSWNIYVVRAALGLSSVPTIANRDMLYYSDADYIKYFGGKRWVSQIDILESRSRLDTALEDGIPIQIKL